MNRYYRPTAPLFTSQFVEEQLPTDLMMGYMQMKAGQQAAFAENIGKLQAEADIIPNGLRTEDMAPRVRRKWSTNISDWTTRNINNYDSPQAIAELSAMRTKFMTDPDVLLLKKDYEDSEDYKRMILNSDLGDIDPNKAPDTDELWQFEEGSVYSPYKSLIKYQDVPKQIFDEFSKVPENEETSSYLSYAKDYLGNIVPIAGTKSTNKTNETQYDITMLDFLKRADEGKEPWARYKKEEFKRTHNREMTVQDWYEYVAPIAAKTKELDTSNRWSPYGSSDGASNKPTPESTSRTVQSDLVPRYEGYQNVKKKNIQKNRLRNFFTVGEEFDTYDNNDYVKNAAAKLSREREGFSRLSTNKQLREIKKYTEEINKDKFPIQFSDIPVEDNLRENVTKQLFGNGVDQYGRIMPEKIDGTAMRGALFYDIDKGEIVDGTDLASSFVKGASVSVVGTVKDNNLYKSPFPGAIGIDIVSDQKGGKTKHLLIMDQDLADKQRLDYNLNSYLQDPVSDMGSVFSFTIAPDNKGIPELIINDRTNDPRSNYDDANLNYDSYNDPYRYYALSMWDNERDKYVIKVFRNNPLIHADKRGNNAGILDNSNKEFLAEYTQEYNEELKRIETQKDVWSKIVNDAYQYGDESPLLKKKYGL